MVEMREGEERPSVGESTVSVSEREGRWSAREKAVEGERKGRLSERGKAVGR